MKRKILIIIAVCVGLWAVGSVVTPVLKRHNDNFPDAFNDHVLHERIKTFPTASDAPEPGDGEGIFVLPDWVPQDATDVKVKAQTTGNAKLIRFTLGDTALKLSGEAGCSEGAFYDGPTLIAGWWPEDVGDGAGRPDCSEQYQFRVVVKGDQVYAWSNGDLVQT
ncbi:hypothetical protein [Streptomyces sp. KR80]|uniref:hypothetical protein n=1 Tax=Streptomyces sp. KR80 TaxID=3457426 RepID=UPI003FD3BCFE